MRFGYEEFDLSGVTTYPLKSRASKVRVDDFARPASPGGTVAAFVERLPDILAAADFKAVVRAKQPQHARSSVLAAAARLEIPVTVHVALGTDIIHMHPAASGAAIGDTSLRDFRYFVSNVARLERGVFLNCGSAVVLPEVFLKAVALARNARIALAGLTTVNLDFVRHYRPQTNVVARPTAASGRGYALIGHHEIMIPLLAAAVKAASP